MTPCRERGGRIRGDGRRGWRRDGLGAGRVEVEQLPQGGGVTIAVRGRGEFLDPDGRRVQHLLHRPADGGGDLAARSPASRSGSRPSRRRSSASMTCGGPGPQTRSRSARRPAAAARRGSAASSVGDDRGGGVDVAVADHRARVAQDVQVDVAHVGEDRDAPGRRRAAGPGRAPPAAVRDARATMSSRSRTSAGRAGAADQDVRGRDLGRQRVGRSMTAPAHRPRRPAARHVRRDRLVTTSVGDAAPERGRGRPERPSNRRRRSRTRRPSRPAEQPIRRRGRARPRRSTRRPGRCRCRRGRACRPAARSGRVRAARARPNPRRCRARTPSGADPGSATRRPPSSRGPEATENRCSAAASAKCT